MYLEESINTKIKKKERTNANICKYKYIIYICICMMFRKLLQDLKAGFQEPRTERGDRRITSIPFYIREISMEKLLLYAFVTAAWGQRKAMT